MEGFQVGDVVKLKSGSPAMTVCGIGDPKRELILTHQVMAPKVLPPLHCRWMNEAGDVCDSAFPQEALVAGDPRDKITGPIDAR